VDTREIWFVPSLNPDGLMLGGRENANGEDLNRDYPVPDGGPNMGSVSGTEMETQQTMNFWSKKHVVLSLNYHGGALVANYPWDYIAPACPDEAVALKLSLGYSRLNPPMYASTSFDSGVTNGYAWYEVRGSLQDWSYHVTSGLDITVECSDVKWPAASGLPGFWNDNRNALLYYIRKAGEGIQGIVTDSLTGLPLYGASANVLSINKPVYSDSVGDYHRMLTSGTYNIAFSKSGYRTKTINNVRVNFDSLTILNVQLSYGQAGIVSGTVIVQGAPNNAGAIVTAVGTVTRSDTTDAAGSYALSLPAGIYAITASKSDGYQDSTVAGHNVDGNSTLNYTLYTSPKFQPTPDNATPTPTYYAVEDSDGVNRAPVYQWVEIRSIGTQLTTLVADDGTAQVTIPFTFKWYGTGYTTLSVCTNGWISFGTNTSTAYTNTAIPSSAFATPTIFANWDDLTATSSITGAWIGYYYDSANRRFIVEWDSVASYSSTTTRHKFQVILYDSTGTGTRDCRFYDAVVQYQMLTPGTSSSVGFQNSSTIGAQELFDGSYASTMTVLGNQRAVRLTGHPTTSPSAVTFANMSAQSTVNGIELFWRTESELDCYQWEVERSQQPETGYQTIARIGGNGTTNQPTDYHYTDAGDLSQGAYYYRLTEVDGNGNKTTYGPMFVQVGGRELPLNYELGQCRPNPSSGKVSISFALKKAGKTTLTIYNITGQAVRRLENGQLPAGYYTRTWDGRDMEGKAVSAGIYFYRLSSGDYTNTRKLTVLR
jgi:hypothetical protein